MPDPEIHALHGRPVLILTHDGHPVSIGKLQVSLPLGGAGTPRVDLVFETEVMACAIGIPLQRIPSLQASFDGTRYTHRLPQGDRFWRPTGEDVPRDDAGMITGGTVEGFPLPTRSRLIGFNPAVKTKL